jgi:hypothetical protein
MIRMILMMMMINIRSPMGSANYRIDTVQVTAEPNLRSTKKPVTCSPENV